MSVTYNLSTNIPNVLQVYLYLKGDGTIISGNLIKSVVATGTPGIYTVTLADRLNVAELMGYQVSHFASVGAAHTAGIMPNGGGMVESFDAAAKTLTVRMYARPNRLELTSGVAVTTHTTANQSGAHPISVRATAAAAVGAKILTDEDPPPAGYVRVYTADNANLWALEFNATDNVTSCNYTHSNYRENNTPDAGDKWMCVFTFLTSYDFVDSTLL